MPPQPIIVQGTEAVLAYLKDQHELKSTTALANKKDAKKETNKEGASKKYNNKNTNEYQSMTKGF